VLKGGRDTRGEERGEKQEALTDGGWERSEKNGGRGGGGRTERKRGGAVGDQVTGENMGERGGGR